MGPKEWSAHQDRKRHLSIESYAILTSQILSQGRLDKQYVSWSH